MRCCKHLLPVASTRHDAFKVVRTVRAALSLEEHAAWREGNLRLKLRVRGKRTSTSARSDSVPSKALRLAAVLILAASQTAIAERTFARGGSSGVSHGHVVGGSHFPHGHFGHRLRRNPVFIAPYGWGWDWPYADYNGVPSAGSGNTTIVAYPPPLSSGRASNDCHWNEDTFTVPSSAGGTRPVQVMNCR